MDEFTLQANLSPNKYTLTEISLPGEPFAYGIGFAEYEDYEYFKYILKDNKVIMEMCITYANTMVSRNVDVAKPLRDVGEIIFVSSIAKFCLLMHPTFTSKITS